MLTNGCTAVETMRLRTADVVFVAWRARQQQCCANSRQVELDRLKVADRVSHEQRSAVSVRVETFLVTSE